VTARGDQTKAKLIHATTSLVTQVGYHHTTTRAIAEAAGVSEGTIYRHYPDKRALFFAAILDNHQELMEWMSGLPDQAGTATLTDTLTECLLRLSQLRQAVLPLELALATNPDLTKTGDTKTGDVDSLPATVAALGGPPHQLAQYLAAEQRLGRIRPDLDPVKIAVILLAALFALAASPIPPTEVTVADVVTIFVEGITTES
jgi:AcrR family transcriptional regulator